MRYILHAIAVLAVFALVLSGCKKDDATTNPTPSSPASGTFSGILAGSTPGGVATGGTMTINIPASKSVPTNESQLAILTVTGSYTMAGGVAVPYSGSYNTDNDSLLITVGSFHFKGTYNRTTGALTGEWSDGTSTGSFVAQTGSGTSVALFLGKVNAVTPVAATGSFNLAIKGTVALGVVAYSNKHYPFTGTVIGDSIALKASFSGVTFPIGSGKFTSAAHDSLSGAFSVSAGSNSATGNWSAKKAN